MTFSIVAHADGQWGVAVASRFLAVGAAVPAARADTGALATQAWANLTYRPDGLALLGQGCSAEDVVARLTGADDGRDHRQLGVVDAEGGSAAWTGASCTDWAGHLLGAGFSAQGNILTGPDVLEAMADSFQASPGPLAARLVAALQAGDVAGGDKRGRQSAALFVVSEAGGYGGGSDVLVDLRVDDHGDPTAELSRLLTLHSLYFGKPERVLPWDDDLRSEVQSLLDRAGYSSLDDWAGVVNLEERMVTDGIDPVVLEQLRGGLT